MSRMKLIVMLAVPAVLLPLVFTYDAVRATVQFEATGFTLIREMFIITSFVLISLYIRHRRKTAVRNAPKEIGRVLVTTGFALFVVAVGTIIQLPVAQGQGSPSAGQSALLMFALSIIAVTLGSLSSYLLFVIHDLVLFKRRKATTRYYLGYIVLLFITCALNFPLVPQGIEFLRTIFFSLAIVIIIFNTFRQNWIVYLSKREKIYSIVYSALIVIVLTFLNIFLAQSTGINGNLTAYSGPLHAYMRLNIIFGTLYFSVAFISTLFHLPTAEVFERKQSELSSLHNLSRLVSQLFDFNDLVNTVTQMTAEVCGASSVWLELLTVDDATGEISVDVVSKRNITQQEIDGINSDDGTQLRRFLLDTHKVLLIEDIWSDRRTKNLRNKGFARGSLLTVPLLSHGKLIGVLNATKDVQNAFDQDDIDVMTTFADNVSIAIENSRLIAKSIERERLHQEMMVAQRMQRRLLPQSLPQLAEVEFAVVSESSLEVGGDYYDLFRLPEDRIGIIVGDVSGKGVSAAFYMAEVKGIVLSLSKLCATPRDLLVRANETLVESLEKKAFISVVYGVLDIKEKTIKLARAGHCPVIYISSGSAEFMRTAGLGLGLTNGIQFEQVLEERNIKLIPGDVCVFYTDGITEARTERGEEYGYERLMRITNECKNCSANDIKENILRDVRTFIGQRAYTDDVTLIVMKWHG